MKYAFRASTLSVILFSLLLFSSCSKGGGCEPPSPITINHNGPRGGSRAGLGWFVRNVENRKLISHSGQTGTFIGYFPDEKLLVVLLTNLGKGIPGVHQVLTIQERDFC